MSASRQKRTEWATTSLLGIVSPILCCFAAFSCSSGTGGSLRFIPIIGSRCPLEWVGQFGLFILHCVGVAVCVIILCLGMLARELLSMFHLPGMASILKDENLTVLAILCGLTANTIFYNLAAKRLVARLGKT